jgi:penicillin-binding protein 1A
LIAACEKGLSPTSLVVDQPLTAAWPSNGAIGYRGRTTLVEAFASSRNAAAVRLTRDLGAAAVAATARRIGIDTGPVDGPGFVLGTFSTNVLTMTGAYATVANGGYQVTPTGVLAVVDGRGQVRADFLDVARRRVVPERCIEPSRLVLREVVRSGTGRGAALRRWAAYGKTGTSTGNADAWFVGWSEGHVLGVWMGRRRGDEEGTAVAGRGAPADYFRRVLNATNERDDAERGRERVAGAGERPSPAPSPRMAGPASVVPKTRPAAKATAVEIPVPPARPRG